MQPRSRTLSAVLCGADTTRLARPTSITVESEPRRIRVTVQSHASLSTALAEIGSENSISAAGFVEDALDEDHTIVGSRQGQAARLHALFLFVHETLRVGRMPSVHALIVEAPDAELGRFPKQLGLIKSSTERRRGSRQQHEMCETDAAFDHGFLTLA